MNEPLVTTRVNRSLAVIGGRQIICDGVNANLCNDGHPANLRLWGIRPPTTDFSAAEGAAGNVTAGVHLIAVTFAIVKAGAIYLESNIKQTISITATGSKTIALTNLPLSDSDAVNARVVYLTKAGGATLYRLATAAATVPDNTTTTYTIDLADTQLSAVELSYKNGFLPAKPYALEHNNQLLLWGGRSWSRGTVQVVAASPTVTGTGTNWTRALEGQRFRLTGDALYYTISAVNVSAQTLTLAANYAGSNATGQSYLIRGVEADLYCSELLPLSPEGYQPAATTSRVISVRGDDGDEPRGLMRMRGNVYLGKARHLYLLSGTSPENFDLEDVHGEKGEGIGLASHWAWSQSGEGPLIWYAGAAGLYMMEATIPVCISRGLDPLFASEINHALDERSHAVWYAPRKLWLLWTARSGETRVLDKVLVGDFAQYPQRIGWWEWRLAAASSRVIRGADGLERIVLGNYHGQTQVLFVGWLDGTPENITVTGALTATDGASTLTDTNAYFGAENLAGVRVTLLTGAAAGQSRFIASNTLTELTIDTGADFGGFFSPVPAAGDKYMIGGYPSYWVSPDLNLGQAAVKRWQDTLALTGELDTSARLGVQTYGESRGDVVLRSRHDLYTSRAQRHRLHHAYRGEFIRYRFGTDGPAQPWQLRRFVPRAAAGRGVRP